MTRRGIFKATLGLAGVIALAGIVAFVWLDRAPRRTPSGQPSLATLDAATLPAFREAFNRDLDRVRVLALLSPT